MRVRLAGLLYNTPVKFEVVSVVSALTSTESPLVEKKCLDLLRKALVETIAKQKVGPIQVFVLYVSNPHVQLILQNVQVFPVSVVGALAPKKEVLAVD